MSVFQLERDGDVDGLVETVMGSDNPSVRGRAVEALGGFEDSNGQVVNTLVDVAVDDDDAAVRANAIDALDQLGLDAIERLLIAATDADRSANVGPETFIEQLSAETAELRMAATYAVGRREISRAIPELLDLMEDPDPRVRARAVRACGLIGDARALDAVRSAASDEVSAVRQAAAFGLGGYSGSDALATLQGMLDDPNTAVRREAVIALGGFGDLQPVDAVVGKLSDQAEPVRRAAVYAVIELLANAPTDRSHEIRETVVTALNRTEDRGVVEPLAEILEESNQPLQRRNAAWLLGRLDLGTHENQVVGGLVETLDDQDDLAAQFAATSLASIGGPVAEEQLLEELDRTTGELKATIVFTLGKIGDERSKQRIDQLIDQTDDPEVRKRAFAALSRLGGR